MKRELLRLFVALAVVILSFPAVMPSASAFDVIVSDDFHDTRGIESSMNIVVSGGEAKLLPNTKWVSDPVASGLGDVKWSSTPTVFKMGEIWYLISGNEDGTFTGFRRTGAVWVSYPAIVYGLVGVGWFSTPTVFEMGETWYLISGNQLGTFTGFRRTDAGWVPDTTIVLGLGDVSGSSTPTVFKMGEIWYLISGNGTGDFRGFKWTGTGSGEKWEPYPAIVFGLVDVGWGSTPTVFEMGGTWYLISGWVDGTFTGFRWNPLLPTPTWVSHPAIVSGLGFVGAAPTPTVFERDETWYLISGNRDGTFTGFNWTGTKWVSKPIVYGLVDVGYNSTPTVFERDETWYLISGNRDGNFTGFKWTGTVSGARWEPCPAIVSNLGSVGWNSTPTVFKMGEAWYMISGNLYGDFRGFKWNPLPHTPTWVSDSAIVSDLGSVGWNSTPTVFEMGGTWYLISGSWAGTFTGFNWIGYQSPGILTSITSTTARQIVSVAATIDDATSPGTTVVYYVSVDNGATWDRITNGQTLTFTGIGNKFKWKADLSTPSPLATPAIHRVSFGITIQPPPPPPPIPPSPGNAHFCFIATAAYGTPMAEEVEVLSRFRDQYLLTNELGRRFVSLYYRHSPVIAEYISNREWAKRIVRIALSPLVRIAEFIVGE